VGRVGVVGEEGKIVAKEKKAKPPKVEKVPSRGRSKPGILPEEELDKLLGPRQVPRTDPSVDSSDQAAADAKLIDDAYNKD
jgi:hypothetical protein